jgi:tetratricopeptide (TPR) repeat protein
MSADQHPAEPPHADLHLQALERFRAGDRDTALALLHQALAADPGNADIHNSLGVLLGAAGDAEGAIVCFAQATRLAPNDAGSFANLGLALRGQNRTDAAIAAFSRAEALDPQSFEVRLHLGMLLRTQGSVAGALLRLREAVALRPDHPGANMALATALHAAHRQAEAVGFYDRVIALRSDLAHAHAARALALQELDRLDDAIAGHLTALALRPELLETRCNLAQVLRATGDVSGALREAGIASAAHPESSLAQICDGFARLAAGDEAGGEAALRRGVALPALTAEQHCASALVALLLGDWAAGWDGYEARWQVPSATPSRVRTRSPEWDGGPLAGRRILLFWEQGLGDTLQFLRYANLVAVKGGEVVLWVQPPVAPLLADWPGVTVVAGTEADLPQFDVQCSLLSLPRLFATRPDSIPGVVPYLKPPTVRPRRSGALQVGLAWSGRAAHRNDAHRSVALAALAPVLAVPGCDFHVLQTEIRAADAGTAAQWPQLFDRHAELHDFADTAALVAGLDLVISVDTAAAHLAGALGVPLWLLLPAVPDWRWLLGRDSSPWYPTARLFRQRRAGAWEPVVARVAAALRTWVPDGRPGDPG